jgi:hypothetical protein
MSDSAYQAKTRIGYVRLPGAPDARDNVLTGPQYYRVPTTPLVADIKNGPLPICPKCKDTKFVVNSYKGPNPPFLECSQCEVEWNGAGHVHPVKKYPRVD